MKNLSVVCVLTTIWLAMSLTAVSAARLAKGTKVRIILLQKVDSRMQSGTSVPAIVIEDVYDAEGRLLIQLGTIIEIVVVRSRTSNLLERAIGNRPSRLVVKLAPFADVEGQEYALSFESSGVESHGSPAADVLKRQAASTAKDSTTGADKNQKATGLSILQLLLAFRDVTKLGILDLPTQKVLGVMLAQLNAPNLCDMLKNGRGAGLTLFMKALLQGNLGQLFRGNTIVGGIDLAGAVQDLTRLWKCLFDGQVLALPQGMVISTYVVGTTADDSDDR